MMHYMTTMTIHLFSYLVTILVPLFYSFNLYTVPLAVLRFFFPSSFSVSLPELPL